MTQPQVKPQARVQVYEGMSVKEVKKNGSDGQKLMAPLFDLNGDGKYNEKEARIFNSYNFTTEKGKITMYRRDGHEVEITELIYDNFEKDVLHLYKGRALNSHERFAFKNDKNESCFFAILSNAKKVVIDMIKGKASVEGGESNLITRNIELAVKDTDAEFIKSTGGKLNLQNVKDKGLIWDSATQIKTDGKTIVDADEDSKVEVSKEEE